MNTKLLLLFGITLLSFTTVFGQDIIDIGVNYMPNYTKSTSSFSNHENRAHHLELVVEEPMTKRLSLYTAIGINWSKQDNSLIDAIIFVPDNFGKSRRLSLSIGMRKYFSKNRQYVGFFGGLYANYSRELNVAGNSFHSTSINTIGIRPEIGYKWLLANRLIAELGTGIVLSTAIFKNSSFQHRWNHQYLLARVGYRFNRKTK